MVGIPAVAGARTTAEWLLALEVALTVEDVGEAAVGLDPIRCVVGGLRGPRAAITCGIVRVALIGNTGTGRMGRRFQPAIVVVAIGARTGVIGRGRPTAGYRIDGVVEVGDGSAVEGRVPAGQVSGRVIIHCRDATELILR